MARILEDWNLVITKRVSVTGIISIPAPLFKRGGHFVASFLHCLHKNVVDSGKST